MPGYRPGCISVAGYDPSGGAGVLADIKTFEAVGVPACAVQTCLTFQNDAEFDGLIWHDEEIIGRQFGRLARRFRFTHSKIGLVRDPDQLTFIVRLLKSHNPGIRIVFDPVRRASAGYEFGRNEALTESVLRELFLLTPNREETGTLGPLSPEENCKNAAAFTNIFLKDGHGEGDNSTDILFTQSGRSEFTAERIEGASKHGSGCVLSSAITGYLSLGHELIESCSLAKEYTRQFLLSSDGLLGWHRKAELKKEVADA